MKAHKLVAIFVGRVPHAIGLVAGGVAGLPDKQAIAMAEKILWEISDFINNSYIPDVIAVAKNYLDYLNIGHFSDFLAYGEFPQQNDGTQPYFMRGIVSNGKKSELDLSKITEQVRFSRYSSESNLHPSLGKTVADEKKENAYSWIKAPRYNGKPMEVGPLARVVINYLGGHTEIKREVDSLLSNLGISFTQFQSSLGRHASRAIEAKLLCKKISEWISLLDYNQMPRNVCEIPQSGNGAGVGEAPRGALGHWISIKNHVIENYQAVVPTTWNASPKDDSGIGGPMEQALLNISIKDEKNPIEAARVVRTFDPCLACAVHCLNNGRKISEYRVC
jgi:Ni,Fe-hydrogenase I large subunit